MGIIIILSVFLIASIILAKIFDQNDKYWQRVIMENSIIIFAALLAIVLIIAGIIQLTANSEIEKLQFEYEYITLRLENDTDPLAYADATEYNTQLRIRKTTAENFMFSCFEPSGIIELPYIDLNKGLR